MNNGDRVLVIPDVNCFGFACTDGACAILRVAVAAATDATLAGYHSYNSCIWIIHSRLGESTQNGRGVNVLWCWVPCNKERCMINL